MVQVQLLPRIAALAVLFVLVIVRFGAVTVTVSGPQLLLPSLSSATSVFGSIAQTPPERGFWYEPIAVGVTSTLTSSEPPAPITKLPPAAEQVIVPDEIGQLSVPVMPVALVNVGVPNVRLELGMSSDRTTAPEAKVAAPVLV